MNKLFLKNEYLETKMKLYQNKNIIYNFFIIIYSHLRNSIKCKINKKNYPSSNKILVRLKNGSLLKTNENESNYLILLFIVSEILEKRTKYCNEISLKIDLNYDFNAHNLYSIIQPKKFKQILSNFIDYSIKLLGFKGTILVSLEENCDLVYVSIKSIGTEIDHNSFQSIMNLKNTTKKLNDQDLVIFQAKIAIKKWGGKILLNSDYKNYTLIQIVLKKSINKF